MKKAEDELDDEMRPEYKRSDLGEGVRGKYYKMYREGTNLAKLDRDVREAFPTDEEVNAALRSLMQPETAEPA
jgi:hypothetical protein